MLSIPSKLPTLSKFVRGLDKGDFLFSKFYKILKNFIKKRTAGELFDYYCIIFK